MMYSSRTFRLFISSTFTDLMEERNTLHKDVFPALQTSCASRGARFQAVDLRWGVSNEAGFDQRTISICLEETRRCQSGGLRPNFLILLGERYGWRPLPEDIPESVFSEVIEALGTERAADVDELKHWYRSDRNAVPPARYLRPRYGQWRKQDRWSDVERRLLDALVFTARTLRPDGDRAWGVSATELEIRAGALDVADARDHVRCFIRGIPHPQPGTQYVETDSTAEGRLASLKARLRDRLGDENCHEYSSDTVRTVLERVLERDLGSLEREDPL
jgi:hypothetical protein